MKVIALATFYNRRDRTLTSVRQLFDYFKSKSSINFEMYLVDDGSSDGTSELVKQHFTEVNILTGTGNLYWSGGMRFGWEEIVKKSKFDYLLAFNDDIQVFPEGLSGLFGVIQSLNLKPIHEFAITGAFLSPTMEKTSYSGVIKHSKWHPLRLEKVEPNGKIQTCDSLNMNIALISSGALKKVGFLSDHYRHCRADYDFGLRLTASGGFIYLAPQHIGICPRNSITGTSNDPDISISRRWKSLVSIKEEKPSERWVYYKSHGGVLWPILWCGVYVKFCLKQVPYVGHYLRSLK